MGSLYSGNHKFPFELLNPIRLKVAARKSKDNNKIPSQMKKKHSLS